MGKKGHCLSICPANFSKTSESKRKIHDKVAPACETDICQEAAPRRRGVDCTRSRTLRCATTSVAVEAQTPSVVKRKSLGPAGSGFKDKSCKVTTSTMMNYNNKKKKKNRRATPATTTTTSVIHCECQAVEEATNHNRSQGTVSMRSRCHIKVAKAFHLWQAPFP